MNIYIICPVRNCSPEQLEKMNDYVDMLKSLDHVIHYPPRDVDQSETEFVICETHRVAMEKCDEVHIFWDTSSKGSHFDLGMAFAMKKKIKLIRPFSIADRMSKNYYEFIKQLERMT